MSGKLIPLLAVFTSICYFASAAYGGDGFTGKYESDNFSIEVVPDGGGYAGQIHLGRQHFPFKARAEAGQLQGAFTSQGHDYDFAATLQGDALTFSTAGKTYALKRAALNPPVPPQAAAAPPGYDVVSASDAGQALTVQKPNATSVQSALESTLSDLTRSLGDRPKVTSAFEDTRDRRSGGASFAARLDGHPIKGLLSCKLGDKGATVAVIYCRADATAAEWNKLASAAPTPTTAPTSTTAPAAEIKLDDYKFPDGTGIVGIAEGWKCSARSCLNGFVIQGPADQKLSMACISVVTPDSQKARDERQAEATARRMGMRPLPNLLLIAPFTEPAQAAADLAPYFSSFSQRNGGPAIAFDHIVTLRKLQANLEGGKAALLSYGITKAMGRTQIHYRAVAQIAINPVTPSAWTYVVTEAAAPDKTFDRDLPAMVAMMNSLRTDDQVLMARAKEQIDANNQFTQELIKQNNANVESRKRWFAGQQEAHREVTAAHEDYNRTQARNSNVRSRNADDFDEVIRGVRTVEDTRTGEKASVDLGNVDHVVDVLNKYDPGRYRQIPLRDEADPLPRPGR